MLLSPPAIFSTAYFPPLHYFAAMIAVPYLLIEKHETYQKQTYRNRCEIYSANGKLSLTVPVKKVFGNHTKIDEVQISNQYKWKKMHWRSIVAAYANSPFFLFFGDAIHNLIFYSQSNLFDYNFHLISGILKLLEIQKEIRFSNTFEKKYEGIVDYRNQITPKTKILTTDFKPYYQSFGDRHGFLGGLSILDLLFHIGPESRTYLSSKY
jgi:hypothetical protein